VSSVPKAADVLSGHIPTTDSHTPQAILNGEALGMAFERGICAFTDIDLILYRSEHVALVGPSGSGKTTLLNCLAGELTPTQGSVSCEGGIARVYQDFRLVDRASARANVMHAAVATQSSWSRRLISRRSLIEKADALLKLVGLEQRRTVRVDRLSGGERQRVAVARALMADPAVILADEPVSALDATSAHGVMQLLTDLCKERGVALLSVQHDLNLAQTYADRVLIMSPSGLQKQGAATSLAIAEATSIESDSSNRESAPLNHDTSNNAGIAIASAMDSPAAWRKTARWTLVAGLALIIVAWAGWMVGLQDLDASRAGQNTLRFLGQLWPTTEQWQSIEWLHLGHALMQTLAMAILGTLAAITWSLPLSALASRGVSPAWLRRPIRIMLNVIRSVPSILWALLCVGALGLGPVPGIIALAAYSTGYLTKFFYEAFEASDSKVPNALKALGMSGSEAFLAATWPASRLAIASSCVFMLEYNFRAASVLGIVGAGGLGYDLKLAVEWANWHVVFVIVLALAASVCVFDAVADYLRQKLK